MSRRNTREAKARRRAERERRQRSKTPDQGTRAVEVQAGPRPDGTGRQNSDEHRSGLPAETDGSLISASSKFGLSGTIEVETPGTDVTASLDELSGKLSETPKLTGAACASSAAAENDPRLITSHRTLTRPTWSISAAYQSHDQLH